jgi:ABC-type dipeptide/oligopeptide/nickel transport system permease component
MGGYIFRRSLLAIPVIIGAITLLFLVFFIVPGDPVEQLGGGKAITPETRAALEHKYDLNKPWYVQYGRYMDRLAHADLGQSYKQGRPVNAILKETAPESIRLALWAILLEVLIGIAAGIVSAVRRYSFLDALTTVSTTMVVAVPVFVLGYLFQYALGVFTFQHGFPAWARFPVQGVGPDRWVLFFVPGASEIKYLILPAVTLASVSTAIVARLTRTTMLEVVRADYMRTAAAKGLSQRQVVLRHGLKNAMIPVVTYIGLDVATLIGSAILTETVFDWPGMGTAIERAIVSLDAPVVLGLTLVLVIAYVGINLLVDLSYAFFDPRIRYGKPAVA